MTLLFDDTKKLERTVGPEAAEVIVRIAERQDAKIDSQKETIKRELLGELATKADIATLRGELREELATVRGEIKRLEVLVKVLIGLTALAVAFFSPVAEKLLALVK